MKNANSKMMDRIAEIENFVLGGFVLDDRGTWVSIADKKSSEEDFLAHLEAGRVLHNGRWVTLAEARTPAALPHAPAAHRVAPEETAVHTVPPVTGAPEYPPETALLNLSPAANQGPPSLPGKTTEAEEAGLYAPETKSIQIEPSIPGTEQADGNDVSSYAMETGLFVIDRSSAADQSLHSETQLSMEALSEEITATPPVGGSAGRNTKSMPVFVAALIPTWEKEESRHKKLGLIIGGIAVAAIGIAAIAIIVLQVIR